jgi:Fic family protein
MRMLKSGSIEEKLARLHELEGKTDRPVVDEFHRRIDMSWIYHDGALEGDVYDAREIEIALGDDQGTDTALMPVYDEIRNHSAAISLVREMAGKRRLKITLDLLKQIYLVLEPEEAESKGALRYRKEMPLHRVYFHEISQPNKISYRMRQLVHWISSNEAKRQMHPVRRASRAHATVLRIYPFPKHNGKLARLLMNLLLVRGGYPPAIIHSTDRQRYYEALRISDEEVSFVVHEALSNSIESALRFFYRLHGIKEPGT